MKQLKNIKWLWDIDCFSEIVEEPKEKINTSEDIKLPLKEGQVVTLLDGKKYEVVKYKKDTDSCARCSLYSTSNFKCCISHINNVDDCSKVLPYRSYFKLCEDRKTENNSSKSLTISNFKVEKGSADESCNSSNSIENSSIKEIGIITKVNFTLIDFKPEELEYSKFTIL